MAQIPYPWLKSYPDGIAWDMDLTPRPVFVLLEQAASQYPDNPAFDFLGKRYNWALIYNQARQLAKGLQDKGYGKGHRIGLLLPNSPYYLISYYAVLMTGATAVNLNPLYADLELMHLINDSELACLITADLELLHTKLMKIKDGTGLREIVMCRFTDVLPFPKNILFPVLKAKDMAKIADRSAFVWYHDLIRNDGAVVIPSIDPVEDVAVLQYTGGTTGTPKGAMLSHQNIYINAVQAKAWFNMVEPGKQKMLGVLPFFHVFAMTAVMNFSVANALEIVAMPRFELKEAMKIITKKRPQLFPAVPAIYNAINNCPERKKYDLSSLKYCLSGGAPLTHQIKKQFEENYPGVVVIEGYGLTESAPVVCGNPVNGVNKIGSIGLPFPGTIVEIVSPADKTTLMPIGERGELCARGPQVMKGYWKNDVASADVLRKTPDGSVRLHTGDIAIMDEDGYVFIVDRIKDMIITNGYNVYPRNVEEAIYKHPSVEECIVAGLPDEQRGEIVKAWIKLKPGREMSETDLKDYLKEYISPMEIPRRVEFREEPLPKTMIGKLSRKDVLAQEVKT
jgi:long-chain acyl-CoA synthetase